MGRLPSADPWLHYGSSVHRRRRSAPSLIQNRTMPVGMPHTRGMTSLWLVWLLVNEDMCSIGFKQSLTAPRSADDYNAATSHHASDARRTDCRRHRTYHHNHVIDLHSPRLYLPMQILQIPRERNSNLSAVGAYTEVEKLQTLSSYLPRM